MARRATDLRFEVGTHGVTSGALFRAAEPIEATLVFAHGAGAPRTHPFIVELATKIAALGVDVVTFNFLYAEAGRRLPDRPELLETCWRAAITQVRARTGFASSRLFIGGKSMGGRFATRVAADMNAEGVVCAGYPLHPAGKPAIVRDEILRAAVPLLVVQGTRDELGGAAELRRYLAPVRGRARVHAVEGADHSLARATDEVAEAIVAFVHDPLGKRKKAKGTRGARTR